MVQLTRLSRCSSSLRVRWKMTLTREVESVQGCEGGAQEARHRFGGVGQREGAARA